MSYVVCPARLGREALTRSRWQLDFLVLVQTSYHSLALLIRGTSKLGPCFV